MSAKKTPAVLEVVFKGSDILPEKIPFMQLSDSLSAVQRIATGQVVPESADERDSLALRLLGVERGSAVFSLATSDPQRAITNLRIVGRTTRDPEEIGHNDFILKPLKTLSGAAKALNCTIVLRDPKRRNEALAEIEADTYAQVTRTLLITGDTSFTGTVLRVGGATELKCGLRVHFQDRMLICTVPEKKVARFLGHKLYQSVAVHGPATWLKTTWRIISFQINTVLQPKNQPLESALEQLWEAGGKHWDQIADPETFLNEVSGDRS